MADQGTVQKSRVPINLGAFFSITVDVRSAVESEVSYSNVCTGFDADHVHEPSGVKQKLNCPICNFDGPFQKGRKEGSGYRIATTKELEAAKPELPANMVITVHDRTTVESQSLPGGSVYYLTIPKGDPPAGYVLLRELLKASPDKVAVTIWGLKGKPHMFKFGLHGDTVTISQLVWPEAVRSAPEIPSFNIGDQELKLGAEVLALSERAFSVADYRDIASAAKAEVFETKELVGAGEIAAGSTPADLLALLNSEVKALRKVAPKRRAPRKKAVAA